MSAKCLKKIEESVSLSTTLSRECRAGDEMYKTMTDESVREHGIQIRRLVDPVVHDKI